MGNESGIRKAVTSTLYGNRFTVLIRVALGAMLAFTGAVKMTDPASFGQIVARYGILPAELVPYAASFIPPLELILGLALLIGIKVRAAAALSVLLMTAFIAFLAVNMFRGRSFDCGCFPVHLLGIGLGEKVGPWLLLRNCVFLACFALVYRADRHLFSLENFIEKVRLNNLEKTKYE
ncbi:MAG TPA: MauE/DoxX family redox-associated membrane protein [Spirochaetota bacterium]|nr:MauE/DoxX family redox-associated membrane protein [Spirochaetota bacterium]HPV40070.1 MauE/DoxX family redox-associated membrane protein [Spirochaetota bacterium]